MIRILLKLITVLITVCLPLLFIGWLISQTQHVDWTSIIIMCAVCYIVGAFLITRTAND